MLPAPVPLYARLVQMPFGRLSSGARADRYTLHNRYGLLVSLTNYGGTLLSIVTPDHEGRLAEITLGYDGLDGYLAGTDYLGATIGRFANRIAGACFSLDGQTFTLTANQGSETLHGGACGFDRVLWHATPFEHETEAGVRLAYTSPGGEEGFPGTLEVEVSYMLTDENTLVIDYAAAASQATPVSLTQHTYFNLTGDARRTVLDHLLTLNADSFTPVDARLIPTGEIRPVAGTPFDFREAASLGARIDAADEQLRFAGGYDHNFVLAGEMSPDRPRPAAYLAEPASGRVVEIWTTEPCVQLYTGNFLSSRPLGRGGVAYGPYAGVALETQRFPDAPNQPAFPSATVRPGRPFRARTVFRFGVAD